MMTTTAPSTISPIFWNLGGIILLPIIIQCFFLRKYHIQESLATTTATTEILTLPKTVVVGANNLTLLSIPKNNNNNMLREIQALSNHHNNNSINNSTVIHLPDLENSTTKRRIFLIHVGKCGGATLQSQIRAACHKKRNKDLKQICLNNLQAQGESQISKLTIDYMHCTRSLMNKYTSQNATSFILLVRNPIRRFVSAYNMAHPQNRGMLPAGEFVSEERRQFFTCFPTMTQLLALLQNPIHDANATLIAQEQHNETYHYTYNTTLSCRTLGIQTIQGDAPIDVIPHSYYNYRYYTRLTMNFPTNQHKEVFVIRQESLSKDFEDLDIALGGGSSTTAASRVDQQVTNTTVTHGSESYKIKSSRMSTNDAKTLCCFLKDEIIIYQTALLQRAINLLPESKLKTLLDLYKTCGISSQQQQSIVNWTDWKLKTCNNV